VLDLYNKTFKKKIHVETEVTILHASSEVLHPQDMEPFAVTEVVDPQEAEENSITIVRSTKFIYGKNNSPH
jgi:hypothetical protein